MLSGCESKTMLTVLGLYKDKHLCQIPKPYWCFVCETDMNLKVGNIDVTFVVFFFVIFKCYIERQMVGIFAILGQNRTRQA